MTHFACTDCSQLLGGQRYFIKQSRPYCCSCFERQHTELCATCGLVIGVEQGQIAYEGQYWHARDECFKCATCSKSLQGSGGGGSASYFIPRHGQVYCSNACVKAASGPSRRASPALSAQIANQTIQTHSNIVDIAQLMSPLATDSIDIG